jgi:hypothetical protein
MTEKEYKLICKRVDKGKEEIDKVKGWFNPKYQHWVKEYEMLAQKMLDYEIDNDLLPI